ncbi:MAG: hypothetical protein KDA42_10505 [Planctomycetales bacterium]|nr:hypothetical protein [Planctomycetales bacterium]
MGIGHRDGYSASVEGFLYFERRPAVRLAKTNAHTLVLADRCELPPGAEGDLVIVVDGEETSRRVMLPEGIELGQRTANYITAAPF